MIVDIIGCYGVISDVEHNSVTFYMLSRSTIIITRIEWCRISSWGDIQSHRVILSGFQCWIPAKDIRIIGDPPTRNELRWTSPDRGTQYRRVTLNDIWCWTSAEGTVFHRRSPNTQQVIPDIMYLVCSCDAQSIGWCWVLWYPPSGISWHATNSRETFCHTLKP